MAMIKCRECGKELSNKADQCPHCGVKIKRTNMVTKAVAVLIGATVLISIFSSSGNSPAPAAPAKTSKQIADEKQSELRFNKIVAIAQTIKNAMRDPDSLVWESIRSNDDVSVICIEYRARNGFGGMTKEFAIYANSKMSQEAKAWNKHCTQPMHDMKHVKYALK